MMAPQIYSAKVTGMAFIDEEAASWLALEALVISVGLGEDFNSLYTGLLAIRFFDWLHRHHIALSDAERSKMLSRALKLERSRNFAREVLGRSETELADAVAPLGRAVSLIWHKGLTKAAALQDQADYGHFLHRADDPGHEKTWPKSMNDVSVRTLERKWAKYQRVLPHVMLIYLRQLAIQKDHEKPLITDLQTIADTLHHKLMHEAKTRKPNLLPWLTLQLF